jgi:hypothetical protein
MQNLSDNDLDRHFQEAAEKFRPPYDPAAWQAMRKRLDKPDGGAWPAFQRGLPFLLIFLAGTVTGILTWSYYTTPDKQNGKNRISINIQKPDSAVAGDPKIDDDGTRNTTTKKAAPASDSSDIRLATETSDPTNQNNDSRFTSDQELESPEQMDSRPGGKETKSAGAKRNPAERHTADRPDHSDPTTSSDVLEHAAPGEETPLFTEAETGETNTAPPGIRGVTDVQPNTHVEVIEEKSDSVITSGQQAAAHIELANAAGSPDQRPDVPAYRLSLIGAYSPDFSSVNFGKQTKPGSNFAALLEYHFSARISLSAGVISSTKLYKASNIEYYGHNYPEAEGDCRIIDIPVNAYYRFGGPSRISWFAGAGFSSYIMKQENYRYYYDSPYGKVSHDKEIRNENNEWFKILNISAGVSRKVSPRFFLEIEPFVKIPLSGIGDGKLDVSTFGMFLRARYSVLKTH